MAAERLSPCKVNFILNILGRRPDGFHELETLMHHVQVHDRLEFEIIPSGIHLTCSDPTLPTDSQNLVVRAAEKFFALSGVSQGIRIHLQKNLPLAAGLGGGSSNAAHTLLGLDEIFRTSLPTGELHGLAATLGSDVPFFLQDNPALAVGRGEEVHSLAPFKSLDGCYIFLVYPGFGVSTPWAYKNLARFPEHLNGRAGRARQLADALTRGDFDGAKLDFYNSLEAPVLEKYPLLKLFQRFMLENGAEVAMMSGSGSTTFAITESKSAGEKLAEKFRGKFGDSCWQTVVPL